MLPWWWRTSLAHRWLTVGCDKHWRWHLHKWSRHSTRSHCSEICLKLEMRRTRTPRGCWERWGSLHSDGGATLTLPHLSPGSVGSSIIPNRYSRSRQSGKPRQSRRCPQTFTGQFQVIFVAVTLIFTQLMWYGSVQCQPKRSNSRVKIFVTTRTLCCHSQTQKYPSKSYPHTVYLTREDGIDC